MEAWQVSLLSHAEYHGTPLGNLSYTKGRQRRRFLLRRKEVFCTSHRFFRPKSPLPDTRWNRPCTKTNRICRRPILLKHKLFFRRKKFPKSLTMLSQVHRLELHARSIRFRRIPPTRQSQILFLCPLFARGLSLNIPPWANGKCSPDIRT